MMNFSYLFCFMLGLALLSCSCWGKEDNLKFSGDPLVAKAPQSYQLAALDKVTILEQEKQPLVLEVNQEGFLILPKENWYVLGQEAALAREAIKKKLGLSAATLVTFEEFRANRISIVGEVYHQIHREMIEGPMRVMDAIASANGFTALANTRRVRLIRQNADRVEVYELNLREVMQGRKLHHNLIIKPGDVITVPKNFL
jgi:protein involved in polysaccharide export with SLBB domain